MFVVPTGRLAMKKAPFETLVCSPWCRFYKGGKEEMACAGLIFFQNRFEWNSLNKLLQTLEPMSWNASEDQLLAGVLCDPCEFRVDGCGFREGEEDSPPCGGYILLELLIRQGLVQREDL